MSADVWCRARVPTRQDIACGPSSHPARGDTRPTRLTHHLALQHGALVFAAVDARLESDGNFVAVEAAGHGVVMRRFDVTPDHFPGMFLFPNAAGRDLVPGAGGPCATRDEALPRARSSQ